MVRGNPVGRAWPDDIAGCLRTNAVDLHELLLSEPARVRLLYVG